MTYGQPAIAPALERLRRRNVQRLLVLPLYPQYSSTTTGSSLRPRRARAVALALDSRAALRQPVLRRTRISPRSPTASRGTGRRTAASTCCFRSTRYRSATSPPAIRITASATRPRVASPSASSSRERMVDRLPVAFRPRGMAAAVRRRDAAYVQARAGGERSPSSARASRPTVSKRSRKSPCGIATRSSRRAATSSTTCRASTRVLRTCRCWRRSCCRHGRAGRSCTGHPRRRLDLEPACASAPLALGAPR